MNLDTLKEIVKVAKESGVAELSVEAKDFKVSVSFMQSVAPITHHIPVAPVVQHPSTGPQPHNPTSVKAAADKNLHVIKSPFVGTFYASPSPGKPVYSKVGDKVKAGQTLCVLEAMKIMNEIDADISGEIIEMYYKQSLFLY